MWQINRLPEVIFGVGTFEKLPAILQAHGQHILLITGQQSFTQQPLANDFLHQCRLFNLTLHHERVAGEPSPEWVDHCVKQYANTPIDILVGIGGGSALDAAKAVAGLLPIQRSVMDYLEGVGPELTYEGAALPFIAVPTTAGTGAEATKNAVLSRTGKEGFKKSFRHETLMPKYAIIDPSLMQSLPRHQIAANGLDALTQLIEGYTSLKASPFTDALAMNGLQHGFNALPQWFQDPHDLVAAESMAWAALSSGMVLAHSGLGAVHGMVAPLGALHGINHGLGCGILLAETTAKNIEVLTEQANNDAALAKYATIGRLLLQDDSLQDASALRLLIEKLREWQDDFNLPKLSSFGITKNHLPIIATNSRGNSMKTNPVLLSDKDLIDILTACL